MTDNIQEPFADTPVAAPPSQETANPSMDQNFPAAATATTTAPPPPPPTTASAAAPSVPTPTVPGAPEPAAPLTGAPQKTEDAPSLYIKRRVVSLVYWENPYCSGGVLAGLLGVLILTQYYSVLQMAAAFFTLVTGVNLIYVNAHKQGQRVFNGKPVDEVTNPHSQRFKATYIPRDRVVRTAQLAVDVVEAVVQQVIRLVLIEDSWRSAWAVAVAYLVWTLATYVSTKYLAVAFLLGAFSVPRIYSQNQELIDNQVAQCSAQGRAIVERYGSVASKKAKDLYGQAVNAVSKKKTA